MANETKYINLSDDTNVSVSTKLYVDKYNNSELAKSVDLQVTELIKPLPNPNLDLVPRPVYDAEVQLNTELQAEINILNITIDDLNSQLTTKTADSASLVLENDALKLKEAKSDNNIQSIQTTVSELRGNLTNSLTKAINEATEKTALEAENNGLTAQKNALIKQIDTLNNLLAQANASLQVAQQQLSAKQQAIAAGGVSTGELATILWEKGDPAKNGGNGVAIDLDLIEGGSKVLGPAKYATSWSSNYVDVVAGPKDINVSIRQTFFSIESSFSIKANETKRITFNSPIQSKVPSGTRGWTGLGKSLREYEETITFVISDVDPNGKTEDKNWKVKVHSFE
jgi:hypothetical protein